MRQVLLAAATLAILAVPANAADQRTVTWALTVDEVQILINAASTMPWKDVNPLLQRLISQTNGQLAAQNPPEPPVPTKPEAAPPPPPAAPPPPPAPPSPPPAPDAPQSGASPPPKQPQ